MFIDTHCHIFHEDYDDISGILKKISNSNVSFVIVNGIDMSSNHEVLSLTSEYKMVYGAIGFHPTELDNFDDSYFEWLDQHIDDDKIVALGEIGLDYHYENTNKEMQKYVFKKQLEIAKKHNKPVIVHSRDAIQDTYDILKEYNLNGCIHCFSGSLEMAREFIRIGFYLGLGGVVTYKNAKNIENIVKNISIDSILLETDSPYLTPEPFRNLKNDSSYIPIIANKISEIKGISVEKVGEQTTKNAYKLFDF